MFWFKESGALKSTAPPAPHPPPPPPKALPTNRCAPLFNYIELFAGKSLSDDDKDTVIALVRAAL